MKREVSPDGRVARRQRNRERVVAAYVELLREGVANPSAADLAERADVTARTVYRYLSNDGDLRREVAGRIVATFRFLDPTADGSDTSLSDRIWAYVTFGLDVYRRTAPIMRTARANSGAGLVVDEAVDSLRELIRQELATLFAHELAQLSPADQRAEIVAIHVFLLFDSLEYMHEHLDGEAVRSVLCRHLRAVLSTIGAPAGHPGVPPVDAAVSETRRG